MKPLGSISAHDPPVRVSELLQPAVLDYPYQYDGACDPLTFELGRGVNVVQSLRRLAARITLQWLGARRGETLHVI